jgi:hypothetical protein
MILPMVMLPADGTFAVGEYVTVRCTHTPAAGQTGHFDVPEELRTFETEVRVEAAEGGLRTAAIPDQLGWQSLDGVRLVLRIEVSGVEGVLTSRLIEVNPHSLLGVDSTGRCRAEGIKGKLAALGAFGAP